MPRHRGATPRWRRIQPHHARFLHLRSRQRARRRQFRPRSAAPGTASVPAGTKWPVFKSGLARKRRSFRPARIGNGPGLASLPLFLARIQSPPPTLRLQSGHEAAACGWRREEATARRRRGSAPTSTATATATSSHPTSALSAAFSPVDGMDVLAMKQACNFAKEHAIANGPIVLIPDPSVPGLD
uniref:Dehydrogenase E1 component domain-containing protein n=1 Tax=Oryza meridionalis TaxID=40149 RepID=A0A0E0D4L5_9ORYZ